MNSKFLVCLLGLRAIKLLATYLQDPSSREIVLMQLKEWLSESAVASNKTLATVAATIFLNEDNIKEAFKTINNGSNMEQLVCAAFRLPLFVFLLML